MKKSFGILSILLSSGIVLGGAGMYLVHQSMSVNVRSELTSTTIKPNTRRATTGGGFQLNHVSFQHLYNHYQSSASLRDPSLDDNAFERRLAVYSFVAGITSQELATELQAITSETQEFSRHVQNELQAAVLERLAIVNPKAAIDFIVEQYEQKSDQSDPLHIRHRLSTGNDTSMPEIQTLFRDWATTDPHNAVETAKTLVDDSKNNALIGILAAQSGQSQATYRQISRELGDEEQGIDSYVLSLATIDVDDPRAAWDEVVALFKPNNFNYTRALRNITGQWYEHQGFGVLDRVSGSRLDKNFKADLIERLLTQAVVDKPDQAFQYSLAVPSENRHTSATARVVSKWATSDPEAAYQAASSIENSGDREYFQRRIALAWASNEPRYVLDNLERFPPNIREYATDDAIRAIARISPEEAAEFAVEHGGGGTDDYLPSVVMDVWIEKDVEAALNWVYSGSLNEKRQYAWISAIVGTLVYSDPRRAFDLAVKQEVPDTKLLGMQVYETGLEADVISSISRRDLALAVELLPKVREGRTRKSAHTIVGHRLIENGDSNRAFDLGLRLTDVDRAEYFQSISWTWARIDPVGLVESIKDFPSEEIRSNVASGLSRGSRRANFTDAQLEILKQYLDD